MTSSERVRLRLKDNAVELRDKQRAERTDKWELIATIVLSLATLASAWSGYQSARWNGEATDANRAATVSRIDSTSQTNLAERQLTTDVSLFSTWVEAELAGNTVLAAAVSDRFRPGFVPAFDSWRESDGEELVTGALPDGSPFTRAEYVQPAAIEAERLLNVSESEALRADAASAVGDNYVLTAVLYASVLFLAGIASKISQFRSRQLAIGLSGGVFLVATGVMLFMPMSIGL
jgi:hypothetical protein